MSPSTIGQLVGALLITFLLTRALHHQLYKTQPPVKKALLVAVTALAASVGVATIGMGFANAVATYPPAIAAWLIFDLVRVRRRGALALQSGTPVGNLHRESARMTPSNRARLLVLLSFPVVIGIAFAFRPRPGARPPLGVDAGELVAWLCVAEIVFVIGVAMNSRRQEHHLTWREFLPRVGAAGVALAVLFGGLMIVGAVLGAIRANWENVGPILVVVGLFTGALAIGLLILYLVVRVVRVAWKGR